MCLLRLKCLCSLFVPHKFKVLVHVLLISITVIEYKLTFTCYKASDYTDPFVHSFFSIFSTIISYLYLWRCSEIGCDDATNTHRTCGGGGGGGGGGRKHIASFTVLELLPFTVEHSCALSILNSDSQFVFDSSFPLNKEHALINCDAVLARVLLDVLIPRLPNAVGHEIIKSYGVFVSQ